VTNEEALSLFKECGAFLQGHFLLTSGLHSSAYLQCALICQEPAVCARFCAGLAGQFKDKRVDVVVGPAMGGIVFAYELARALGTRGIFTERNDEGKMTLRRGFALNPGERVLVAEDVLTTGGSAAEIVEIAKQAGAEVAGVAALVDRGGAKRFAPLPVAAALKADVPTWKPEECPLCKAGTPAVKPGSRKDPGAR
jgi:orotate phosphoribosyltransferase